MDFNNTTEEDLKAMAVGAKKYIWRTIILLIIICTAMSSYVYVQGGGAGSNNALSDVANVVLLEKMGGQPIAK